MRNFAEYIYVDGSIFPKFVEWWASGTSNR